MENNEIKQLRTEYEKQHELLDQYELNCTDVIIQMKNDEIKQLKERNELLTKALENNRELINYIYEQNFEVIGFHQNGDAEMLNYIIEEDIIAINNAETRLKELEVK